MATPPDPTVSSATSSAPSTSSGPTAPTVTISVASSGHGSDLATRVLQSQLQSAQRLGIPPPTRSRAPTTPSASSTETGECHLLFLFCIPLFFALKPAPSVSSVGWHCDRWPRLRVHMQAYLSSVHWHLVPSLARTHSAECLCSVCVLAI